MDVFPDFDGLAGIGDLKQVVGALFMFVLIIAVLMLIVSAICWAIAAAHGNYSAAAKGGRGARRSRYCRPRRWRGGVDELAHRARSTTLTPHHLARPFGGGPSSCLGGGWWAGCTCGQKQPSA